MASPSPTTLTHAALLRLKVGIDPEVERLGILKSTLDDIRGWGFTVDEAGRVPAKEDGETVAHAACAHGRLDVLRMITPLSDPLEGDAVVPLVDQQDDEGFTPLRK